MIYRVLQTLTLIFASASVSLACTRIAGEVDDIADGFTLAFGLFYSGIFVFVVHIGLFIYLSLKKQQRSGWIFWTTVALSIFIIPLVLLVSLMSAGMGCGFMSSKPVILLLIFELICLTAQLINWRFYGKPTPSPIPLD